MPRALLLALLALPCSAEEGMWPFVEPPLAKIKAATGVDIDRNWLDETRKAVVRVNDAGSGSFISRDGLLLTNNHVVVDVLDALSGPRRDLVLGGFRARTAAEELKVPVEVLSLTHMEDVTARMHAAIAKASGTEIAAAIEAEKAGLGHGAYDGQGQWTEVARHNDRFWRYRFVSHEDVRLVFSPSTKAAYFGGDDDRVEEPGTWLDMALLRVYKDGAPLNTPHYFPFDLTGADAQEAAFVAGFPWRTTRDLTEAQLKLDKKLYIPAYTKHNKALRQAYELYGALGPAQKREVLLALWDAEGGVGAGEAVAAALAEPEVLNETRADDARLKAAIAADPALSRRFGALYADIEATVAEKSRRYNEWSYRRLAPESRLAGLGEKMLLYADEAAKPPAERVHDLDELRAEILAVEAAPKLEEFVLAKTLELSRAELGDADAFVQGALENLSPAQAARRLASTTLLDPEARKRLLDRGAAQIRASADPLLSLVRRVRAHTAEVDAWYDEKIAPAEETQRWLMASLRAAVDGLASPPDPSWSLRLSFGRVKGYEHQGRHIPHQHPFGEMFRLHDLDPTDEDFALDPLLAQNRAAIDMTTPLNALAEVDIAGGNSGSAMINAERRLIGLVYAENRFKMAGEYRYDAAKGRSMIVDARGILEALRRGYGMERIAREISRDAALNVARPPAASAAPKNS